MTTAPITSTAAPAAATNSPALGRANLATNFNTFLALLTTQLKNQDPLSPLDSNQFTQQLVQMSGVEQQLQSNDLLTKLVANTGSSVASAVSLIGKDVRATNDQAALVNGKASFGYNLGAGATDVKLQVLDSTGKVVHAEVPSDNAAGDHVFNWNGADMNGVKLTSGTYTLRVTANDPTGKAIAASNFIDGVVTGVEEVNGQAMISINGAKVGLDSITSVSQPTAAQAAA